MMKSRSSIAVGLLLAAIVGCRTAPATPPVIPRAAASLPYCNSALGGNTCSSAPGSSVTIGSYQCGPGFPAFVAKIVMQQSFTSYADFHEHFGIPLNPNQGDVYLRCSGGAFPATWNIPMTVTGSVAYVSSTQTCQIIQYMPGPNHPLISQAPVTVLGGNFQAYPKDGTHGSWTVWISPIGGGQPGIGACSSVMI